MRRHIVTIALAAAIATLLGTNIFLLTQRSVATPVTVDQALANFRAHKAVEQAPASPLAAAERIAVPAQLPASAGSTTTKREASSIATLSRATAVRPLDAAPAVAPALPAEGVYSYRANGGEDISVAGANHHYPDHVRATVRHLGGCLWEHRNDVIKEHVDRRVLCSRPGQLFQQEQRRDVEFFGKRDSGTFEFDPPQVLLGLGDRPGATSTALGTDGKGSAARIKRTYLGREVLIIDGQRVEAAHVRLDSTMTGRATGTAVDDIWAALDTGMTLQWNRSVDTLADAAFGAKVRYREHASFVLESLRPLV